MMAKVLAALRSRLASSVSLFFLTAFSVVLAVAAGPADVVLMTGLLRATVEPLSGESRLALAALFSDVIGIALTSGISMVNAVVCWLGVCWPSSAAMAMASSLLVLAGGSSSFMCSDSSADDEAPAAGHLNQRRIIFRLSLAS